MKFAKTLALAALMAAAPMIAAAEDNLVMAALSGEKFPAVTPFCQVQENRVARLCGRITFNNPATLGTASFSAGVVDEFLKHNGIPAGTFNAKTLVSGPVIFRKQNPGDLSS